MAEAGASRSLADKLNHLFATVHPRNRGEYSSEEVAQAIAAAGGPTISATYIWMLRRGVRDNPTKRHLEALATFFGVPPAYFFDDAVTSNVDDQLGTLAALRDATVRNLALRAAELSPENLRLFTELMDRVLEADPPKRGRRGRSGRPDRAQPAGPPEDMPSGEEPER
jgi:transcriptional regulator with XRE-family HTH domain